MRLGPGSSLRGAQSPLSPLISIQNLSLIILLFPAGLTSVWPARAVVALSISTRVYDAACDMGGVAPSSDMVSLDAFFPLYFFSLVLSLESFSHSPYPLTLPGPVLPPLARAAVKNTCSRKMYNLCQLRAGWWRVEGRQGWRVSALPRRGAVLIFGQQPWHGRRARPLFDLTLAGIDERRAIDDNLGSFRLSFSAPKTE